MLAEVYYSPSEGLSDASPQPAGGRAVGQALSTRQNRGTFHAPTVRLPTLLRPSRSKLEDLAGVNNGFQSRDRSLTVGSYVV